MSAIPAPMECIVLAGSRPRKGEPLWSETQGRLKALVDVGGRPMIAWVLSAPRGSRHIDRIVIVGLDGPLEADGPVEFYQDEGDLVSNLYAGIGRLSGDAPAAYCWSDIPLIRPAMIDRYIESVTDPELDVNVGLVPRASLQARYPAANDLWLRLAEGDFIAADFGLFHPRHARRLRHDLEIFAPQRKSAVRQALHAGLPVVLRYLTRRLSILRLVGQLEKKFELRCCIRIVGDPELGLDVDGPAHLAICRREIGSRP